MRSPVLHRVAPSGLLLRSDGDGRTVVGLACPFDSPAKVSDGGPTYTEVFRRGAFTRSIAERADRVKFHVQHDTRSLPIGRATGLEEREDGLWAELRVSRTRAGDEALELIADGVVDGLSVGFRGVRQQTRSGVVERLEVALAEISLVNSPAYAEALVAGVRSGDGRPHLTIARRRLAVARVAAGLEPEEG